MKLIEGLVYKIRKNFLLKKLWKVGRKTVCFLLFLLTPSAWKRQCVVEIDGGLGSQIAQYFLGQCIAETLQCPVYYDLSWYDTNGKDINQACSRKFELLHLFSELSLPIRSRLVTYIYKHLFYYAPADPFEYDPMAIIPVRRYFCGYYANKRYFSGCSLKERDIFRFTLELDECNLDILKTIKETTNSVAIHLRRGDYLGSPYQVTSEEYFVNGIRYMREKLKECTFFVFSNDIAWCKRRFKDESDFYYCDANDNDRGYYDFILMTNCQHFILSNSSFSFYAVALCAHKHGLVISPDIMYHDDRKIYVDDVVEQDWIKFPCCGEQESQPTDKGVPSGMEC